MKIKSTKFAGLKIIESKIYKDSRGFFKEDFKKIFLKIKDSFLAAPQAQKNVLRGLHLQTKNMQGKYVSVLKGKILDVVLDLRKGSKTFGKHYSILLSEKKAKSIFIPQDLLTVF